MKANPRRRWKITLKGRRRSYSFCFVGTCDAALHAADHAECEVKFAVRTFIINRAPRLR